MNNGVVQERKAQQLDLKLASCRIFDSRSHQTNSSESPAASVNGDVYKAEARILNNDALDLLTVVVSRPVYCR
jgi:ribosomal 50S subunit-recycling heat shock protein